MAAFHLMFVFASHVSGGLAFDAAIPVANGPRQCGQLSPGSPAPDRCGMANNARMKTQNSKRSMGSTPNAVEGFRKYMRRGGGEEGLFGSVPTLATSSWG